LVLSSDAKPEMLEKLAKAGAGRGFYLLRLISETSPSQRQDAEPAGETPYGAIRENVARHPKRDAGTLTWLSRDRSQPLWYLVAFIQHAHAAATALARSPEAPWRKPSIQVESRSIRTLVCGNSKLPAEKAEHVGIFRRPRKIFARSCWYDSSFVSGRRIISANLARTEALQ